MTRRMFWFTTSFAILAVTAVLSLSTAQARGAATSAPTVPPMQMHAQPIQQPPLAPCPPGTGITVAPAGAAPFTAQSVEFETGTALSDKTATTARAGGRVKIVKLSDASSTFLNHALTKSTMISSVTITFHKSRAEAPSGMFVTLSGVSVVGIVNQRTSSGAQETVTLSYQKLSHTSCGS